MNRVLVAALTLTLFAVAAGRMHAQTVRGQLTDSISRSPLGGAFLTLVDEGGAERARVITNAEGEFVLSAPAAGSYRIRSKRIGFRPYVSAPLALGAEQTVTFNATVDPIPVPLQQVVVAGDRQCNVEAGASVAALWEEVREALAAVAWTSKAPGYWYEVRQFEREVFSQDYRKGLDSTWRNAGYYEVPFRSAAAEQLEHDGFVVVDQDGWSYYEPDAEVLLSAPFLRTHCFETKVGKGDTEGLVGLAFSPARGRRLPDITGTLWVDRQTAELRHLEFKYIRLPLGLNAPNAGGRVEFMRVPTGAWMVRDWIIRMPITETGRTPTGGATFLRAAGYRERGGNATQIKTTAGTVVFTTAQAVAAAPPLAPPPPPAAAAPPPPPPPAPTSAADSPATQNELPTRPSRRSSSRDILAPDEFGESAATDAYALVQQFRPSWLRSRGRTSFQDPTAGAPQLYVNGSRWGDVERLREIPVTELIEIRYRSGQEATMRYGQNVAGGVIEVRTR